MIRAVSELGGIGGIAGGVVAIVAGLLLIAFFSTGDDRLGRANDAGLAITAVLLLPFAVSLNDQFAGTGVLVPGLTIVGVAALLVTAVASALTAAGRLGVQQLLVWQGGSFVVLYGWMAGMGAASLWYQRLPAPAAWIGIGGGALLIVALISMSLEARRLGGWSAMGEMRRPPIVAMIAMAVSLLCLPAWTIWLGVDLLGAP
jgi:hypothetical protein